MSSETAPIATAAYIRSAESAITARIHRDNTLALSVNKELKLYSRPGEAPEAFLARCRGTLAAAGVDYHLVSTDRPVEDTLLDLIATRSRLGPSRRRAG